MSTQPTVEDKSKAAPKSERPKAQEIDVVDKTPFPAPDLYFKVFESEQDEPESKVRRDVNKLYEKWMKEYGRRWPDRGMNTEDLVWLEEEAYQRQGKGDNLTLPSRPISSQNMVTVEKDEYEGEFITEPGEDAVSTAPVIGKDGKVLPPSQRKKKSAKPNLSNYELTKAGGVWVTDEFESDEYIAGNLELLWDDYLWDRDGVPTVMPEGPPDEAAGEESEEWDDFHTAYRPRGIDSDDAREAVWATDEFESDEDNTESEWEPEYVGAGLGLVAEDPINPQYSLRHSTHPLAPFPGEPLKWASYAYADGTTFEGLTRDAVPHGMGVMIFGNGTGGGFHFHDVRRGDKFEGEFQGGYAHGLGMMSSETKGEVYIGEFFAGQKHGCGMKINMKPFFYLLERGEDPLGAYSKTYADIMRNIEFRTWFRNKPLGSDYEDEVVLASVGLEGLENPYDAILKADLHEEKLRNWRDMTPEQKATTKMGEIIQQVGGERMAKRAAHGFKSPGYFTRDEDGFLVEDLDSMGNDTDYDSMDLMVGNTTEGGFGLGWVADNGDLSEYPYDPKLLESIAGDIVDYKLDESDDKEAILGGDILNPYTGLSVKDYLEGREARHTEFFYKTAAAMRSSGGRGARRLREGYPEGAPPGNGLLRGVRRLFQFGRQNDDDEEGIEAELLEEEGIDVETTLTPQAQKKLADHMVEMDEIYGPPMKPVHFEGGTDTRFETESEAMELCDLAEILGTVEEAQEIVAKARMWRWKPYGEVTLRFAQDGQGVPVDLMQDPLHYPHGTKFMAPGPLGQCHPLPDDEAIRAEMKQVAINHSRVYEMYNFDYDPEPGSVQYKIDQRIKRAQELQASGLTRMEEDVEEELLVAAEGKKAEASQKAPAMASISHSPFASMSFGFSSGMGRASKIILDAFANHARQERQGKGKRAMRS